MDFFSVEYLTALVAIIGIDLVLAGDNAILIALVARKLPQHQQRITIIAGTAGAVVLRVIMTLAVVSLLNIPWLMLIGGVLLTWIAYKLLTPDKSDTHVEADVAVGSLGSAIRTIVVADAVMGLDNVLGVAGAAHGDFSLVVLGLLISVPIMVAGSTIILKYVERHPILVYVGAAILAWTAAKMIHHEPAIAQVWQQQPLLLWLLYGVVIGGVIASGVMRKTPLRNANAVKPHVVHDDRS